jgi:hypothetical protein
MWVSIWKGCLVAHVPHTVAEPFMGHVPQEFQDQRTKRDGTKDLHVTIVTPDEMHGKGVTQITEVLEENLMSEVNTGRKHIDIHELVVFGLGKQQKADNEVLYLLCYCQKFNAIRIRLKLTPLNYYHATCGFRFFDLHGISKDMNTLVVKSAPLNTNGVHTIHNLSVHEHIEREFGYVDPKACVLRFKMKGRLSFEDQTRLLQEGTSSFPVLFVFFMASLVNGD